MALNAEQSKALDIVLNGHNLLILGAAGTGKTHMLKNIVQSLKSKAKCVSITATTGIACCLHENALTVHKWSGIGDGRHGVSEIRDVVQHNAQYADVRKRIAETEVLIIDECSMLGKKLFESLNEVCKLKNPGLSFGGIQLILSGDFTQLPPVPNQLYGEEGEFCFKSELFCKVLSHRVILTEVKRQSEKELIKAIHEVSIGNISKDTENYILSLNRHIPTVIETIKLFARNEQVDTYNRDKIIEFPGELYEFLSEDDGDQKYLNKILAQKTLWLKKGAPVILLRNLTDKLVNGLRGTVYDITEKGPVIDFPSVDVKVPLEKMKFSVFSPVKNSDVAARVQYPVKLSFAISIHKSQGLTLDRLKETSGMPADYFTVDDMLMIDEAFELDDQLPDNEEFDCEFDEVIQMISETPSDLEDLPGDLNIEQILMSIECKVVKTTKQYNTSKIIKEIDMIKYTQFCKQECSKLSKLIEELNIDPTKPVPSKKQSEFYAQVHAYHTSAEFRINSLNFFENVQFTEEHLHVCFNISNQIRKYLLGKKADLFPVSTRKIADRSVTNTSDARVRYVGGYCISKVRYKYMQKKKSYMYKVDESSQAQYHESVLALNVIDSLKVEEYYILETTNNPESLLDVSRKQGQNRSLTNIPDELFLFFRKLTEKCLELLIDENLNKYDSNLFEALRNDIIGNSELYEIFCSVVQTCLSSNEEFDESLLNKQIKDNIVKNIYKKIIKMFLMVMVNQFRKELLESFNIEKKMAHRKQVRVSTKSKVRPQMGCASTSQDNQPIPGTSRDTSQGSITRSSSRIQKRKAKDISDSSEDESQLLSTPNLQIQQEQIHTETKTSDDSNESCKICKLDENQAPDLVEWINCDCCEGWLHRKCAGLQNHFRWKKFNKDGVEFYCEQCGGC